MSAFAPLTGVKRTFKRVRGRTPIYEYAASLAARRIYALPPSEPGSRPAPLLLAAESAADLGSRALDVDVGDARIPSHH